MSIRVYTHLFTVLLLFQLSCANGQAAAPSAKVPLEEFTQHLADPGAQLVDVRSPDEFAAGHLAGAKLIPIAAPDFREQMGKLDKEKPLLLYCAVGGRSGKAAAKAHELGFKKIYDLTGGITAWQAAGKPVEK